MRDICRSIALLLLLIGAGGCATGSGLPEPADVTAQQHIFRDGAPHTSRDGILMRDFDPARSFFPIGIYHALAAQAFGQPHDPGIFAEAGFNTLHLWPVQDMEAALPAAATLGLQVIVQHPTIDFVRRHHESAAILSWMIEDEPSEFVAEADTPARLEAFADQARRIRVLDPRRSLMLVDVSGTAPRHAARWRQWLQAGDVSALFVYPLAERLRPVRDFNRIALSISEAVRRTGQTKPIWFIAQAFIDPVRGWYLPTYDELRGMIYTALVHGATGVIYFAFDSQGTRDGQVLGVAPDPRAGYEGVPDFDGDRRPALVASESQLAQSRALWRQIPALNHELAALGPVLLRPGTALDCSVQVDGPHRLRQPLRLLAKPLDKGRILLLAVNIEAADISVTVSCDRDLAAIGSWNGLPGAPHQSAPRSFRESLPPYGVRAWELTPA